MRIRRVLKHFFVPHKNNNHRAGLLHHANLIVIIFLFIASAALFYLGSHNAPGVLGISYSISDSDLLKITNKYRQEKGLSPLVINENLKIAASEKAQDMFSKDYWAHFAPDGSTTPWYFIKKSGYSYVYAGENLAKGFTTSHDIVAAWMNSPSHRDNMLSDKYTDIGFAVVEGKLQGEETVLVVQMFGSVNEPLASASTPTGPSPTSITAQVPQTAAVLPNTTIGKDQDNSIFTYSLINTYIVSKNIILIVLFGILSALVLDLIIIERKKVFRFVGHNVDHIMMLGFFIALVIFMNPGSIF